MNEPQVSPRLVVVSNTELFDLEYEERQDGDNAGGHPLMGRHREEDPIERMIGEELNALNEIANNEGYRYRICGAGAGASSRADFHLKHLEIGVFPAGYPFQAIPYSNQVLRDTLCERIQQAWQRLSQENQAKYPLAYMGKPRKIPFNLERVPSIPKSVN